MTRIGLLADSHGRAEVTQRAVRLLVDAGAEVLVHLGDLCSDQVIDALGEGVDDRGRLSPPAHVVFGNMDLNVPAMTEYAQHLGIAVDHPVGRLAVGEGRTLIFQHGDRPAAMDRAVSDGVDYLCHGHTHEARNERFGRTRVINPGALCRARSYSVALLDAAGDVVRFLDVPKS